MKTEIVDIGVMRYSQAHQLQLRCVDEQLKDSQRAEAIIITEHPAVFTLGRQGSLAALQRPRGDVLAEGVEIIQTERGGDMTFHGPGQLVVYPIVNLRRRNLSVTEFIAMLENVMIKTAAACEVQASRDSRNRGIWVGDAKLGSVGIRVRHGIAFHGLALNVNLSLEPFSWINPCGLQGVGVTSLAKELDKDISMPRVKEIMKGHLRGYFCEM